ncbi:CoA ester lyase [Donghicola sp. C2-DW-16]|uniref:CoA ester lyase n=1 Tax=Donghicola mangrovi TaxID=2729614 RepID=A0ABX2PES2_9RHOB|nr:aldolase/citrate lyase family protein [Donghicola mangrovi]NVO27302.1 CoA ester lyase [Donghicola mangrovi]
MRSILFVPADREKLFAKAAEGAASVVCLDLEDGVAASAKPLARAQLPAAIATLKAAGKAIALRMNADFDQISFDLAAVTPEVDYVVVPKAGSWQVLAEVSNALFKTTGKVIEIIALVENAKGLHDLETVGRLPASVTALAIGTEDFAADLGVTPASPAIAEALNRMALLAARCEVALLGFPGSIAEIKNIEAFTETARGGKAVGAIGGFAIHPAQVEVLNTVFSLTDDELAAASRIVEAFEAALEKGQGAISLNGRMIDMPVYLAAKRALARQT